MVKKIIFLLLITVFLLSGCANGDYNEPENRTVVTAMFIKYNEAAFTVMLETVKVEEGEKEAKYKAEYLIGEAGNLIESIKAIQAELSSELSLYHCPLIICDKASFQEKQGEIFEYLIKNPQMSLAAYLLCTDNFDYFLKTEREETLFYGYEITDMIELKEIKGEIINILRGRVKPPMISVGGDNKFIFSEI